MEGIHGGNFVSSEYQQSGQIEQLGSAEITATRNNSEKFKRDEWSEGGVLSLLDVYESKWVLRNRAKLKGSDWEDIARDVSSRNSGTKSAKTPNQCKNKIESMKKRYRSESSSASGNSSWQFFSRMDSLLHGTFYYTTTQPKFLASAAAICFDGVIEPALTDLALQELPKMEELEEAVAEPELELKQEDVEKIQDQEVVNCGGGGGGGEAQLRQGCDQEDGSNTLPNSRKDVGSDTSTPKSKIANEGGDGSDKGKKRKGCDGDIAGSIRLLAESMLQIEMGRIEMYREMEKMRVEAEVRRGEMELKRTEILAKTQLQIAKLLGKRGCGRKKKKTNLRPSSYAAAVSNNGLVEAIQENGN